MAAIPTARIIECLEHGELAVEGQFMWGSNYTFLATVSHDNQTLQAVYKPTQGERPLWDFPEHSLAGREVAAFLVSEVLGWEFVPPTASRAQGPAGAGSLQLFVAHDPEYHYFNLTPEHQQRLRPVALFDALINNADRKGGHILFDADDKLWLIDHGLCFHIEPKLRTVVWNFAEQPIPPELLEDLRAFLDKLEPPSELSAQLSIYLNAREIQALAQRAEQLIADGRFPSPRADERSYPWPPI
jgi:uncharacterized repeat protein (TIGR03843 family)